jgi:serine/threonine-protein kinase
VQTSSWQRVKLVIEQALAFPPAARPSFVAHACGNDSEILTEVESLLELADETADDFLETPPQLPPPLAPPQRIGQRFGPYRILRQLGRGGMGEVYLAVREDALQPQQREHAVLKMPRHDLDTPAMRRRLEHEGRLLGRLHHPGIALLRGTGVARTLPYLMLEHVDGIAIDEWCRRFALGPRQRIDLILALCDAVVHAHERGVAHRDIKAANVLVTPGGQPKLLDFGIAQPLHDTGDTAHAHTAHTDSEIDAEAGSAFSGECAAPEQVRNHPPRRSTDVYGLAALTYRLLTGHLPHDTSTHTTVIDTLRAICHDDPLLPSMRVLQGADPAEPGLPPPHALAALLRGEIDLLLSTALARNPAMRHQDVPSYAKALRQCRDRLAAAPAQAG